MARKKLRLKRINLDRLYKLLLNMINDDARAMAKASDTGRLDPKDSLTVINYTKLMKQLRKVEDEETGEEGPAKSPIFIPPPG